MIQPYETAFGTVESHGDEGNVYHVRPHSARGQINAYVLPSVRTCSPETAEQDITEIIAAKEAEASTPPVPEVISRAEFIIALRRVLGITEGAVFALLSQMPAGEEQETARDLWENAREFKRSNSFLLALAQLNGNTPSQIDEVFRAGAALNLD